MKALSRFAVENRLAVIFTALFLAFIGLYLIPQIPQGVFPDASFPRIAVIVDFGLAPLKQMEMEISKPIEEAAMMVPGVRLVRSSISRGSAEINIDFDWHEDMFRAYQLVQAQMSGIRSRLPQGIKMEVRRFTTSTYPVAGFSLYSDKRDLLQLTDLAVYTIRPQLAGIPGVYNIEVMGKKLREYWINLDPIKMAAHRLDVQQIVEILKQNNQLQFVGRMNEFNKLYLNIIDNRYQHLEDLNKIIISRRGSTPVYLEQIAEIEPAIRESFITCESEHRPAIMLTVIKQPGTNAVTIMEEVQQRLNELRNNLPPDVQIRKWYDMTDFIKSSIGSVRDSIFIGALLTFIILLLFLHRFRITLLTVVIIPVALLITFIFIKISGTNLSLMSLGGMAASIGILVDNAIVVVENIERFLEEGYSQKSAVIEATREIISPLLSATLTTLVVFLPLVFLTGVPGIFFRALATTLSIAIMVSMLLAVFLTPALAVVLISTKKRSGGRFMPVLIQLQQKIMRSVLKKPAPVLSATLVLAVIAVVSYINIPSGFLPEWDEGTIVLDYIAPSGSSLEGTRGMLKSISDYLTQIPEVDVYSLRTGRSLAHPRTHPNDGDYVINLKKDRQRSTFEIMDELREFIKQAEPRLEPEIFQVLPDRLNDLSGEIAPIVIKVFGSNLNLIQELAGLIADSLETVPNVVDVYPGFAKGEPELRVHIRPEAATRFGISVESAAQAVQIALWGGVPTNMLEGIKVIPIRIRYPKADYDQLAKIRSLPIYISQTDRVVLLDEIAEIDRVPGKTDINHENLSQVINIKARISGRDLGSIMEDVQSMLKSIAVPPGVTVLIGGQFESQQRAFRELLYILLFGILLVFSILLFEFKSFRTAGVILLGTVLSVTGVFLLLWLTGIPLDISAFMGMIMIIGVVVNNGILLIDYAEKYMANEPDLPTAILQAGRVRMRPILMTMLATIFGFLPLALAIGEGAEMLQPLAVSMIGGMSLSVLLSLFLIPALYYFANHRRVELQTR